MFARARARTQDVPSRRTVIKNQVEIALGDYAEEFDIDAIVEEFVSTISVASIDSVPAEKFWPIVHKHDRFPNKRAV